MAVKLIVVLIMILTLIIDIHSLVVFISQAAEVNN